jgi:KaiC/GvpD/RAD55 family RecA-like ATPase
LDEVGQNKSLQLKTVEIKVEEVVLEDRISTGTEELDSLLLGGIPKEYAVVLTSSPCDERELIVKNFLEAGTKECITFYVTTEAAELERLLKNPNFFLFLCNPKPKNEIPDLPKAYKLQSKADITNLGIALTKAYRSIDQSIANKRVCIDILSDVLVKHGTNTTREWISGLITDLGAKGFTILGLLDPRMHDSKDSFAIINLFDGEISILQSDDPLDCKKSIHVKKLRNQDYIKNPICLR